MKLRFRKIYDTKDEVFSILIIKKFLTSSTFILINSKNDYFSENS